VPGPRHPPFVLREASLKAFLGLRSASAWSRQAGREFGDPEGSRSVALCECGSLLLHEGNGELPFPLGSGRGCVPLWTTVVVLFFGLLLCSWDPQLAHEGPLVFGVGVPREGKPRRTLGAASKIRGTGRFQEQEAAMTKTAAARGPPSTETTGARGQKSPNR
jgi:hypothetical protein